MEKSRAFAKETGPLLTLLGAAFTRHGKAFSEMGRKVECKDYLSQTSP